MTKFCIFCGGSGEGPSDGTNCHWCRGCGVIDEHDDGDEKYQEWKDRQDD